MRIAVILLAVTFLAGCGHSALYSHKDLVQVRQAYRTIAPIYLDFERVYNQGDNQGILRDYHREQVACRLVDKIDKRDTIDPNTKLFEASADLDNVCNTIESGYAAWAKAHGYRYDKTLLPADPTSVFVDMNESFPLIPELLQHPKQLS